MSEPVTEIKRIIGAAIENPQEADINGTVLDPRGGVIKLPIPLINWRGRNRLKIESALFDPEDYYSQIPESELHLRLATEVPFKCLPSYKKYGTVYLNKVQSAANRLVEAIDNYTLDNHPDISQARRFLQGAFSYFEDTIIQTIGGKSGLLSKNVAGLRINYSMMTPAAGTHLCNHNEVLIPESVATLLEAETGDTIMSHREPLLWGRGIVFLTAKVVPQHEADSVRLPWAVFKGMNADVDGDLVFLCNISRQLRDASPENRLEAAMEIERAKERDKDLFEYTASLCLLKESARPDYNAGSSVEDVEERLDSSIGLSFGCEDIFDDGPFLDHLEQVLGVKKERVLNYARDLQESEWSTEIQETAKALCYTKRGLGLVGAIGSFCLALATYYRECLPAAVAVKEGLSQTVLDAKHGEDLDHITECLDALMKSGNHEESTPQQRLDAIVACGFKKEVMLPLFGVLGDDGIVSKVYKDFPGFLLCTTDSNTMSLLERFTSGEPDRAGPGADVGSWWDRVVAGG